MKIALEIYSEYVEVEKDNKVLYVECQNVIYGTLKAALQFYKKFVENLCKFGFKVNDYDPCVANKIINGKQMTIIWHVDDAKISHVDKQGIEILINYLKELYEDLEIGMIKNREKVHDYLGIKLDYSE